MDEGTEIDLEVGVMQAGGRRAVARNRGRDGLCW